LPEVAFWSNCSASLFFIAFPTLFTNSVKLDLNCRQQANALIEPDRGRFSNSGRIVANPEITTVSRVSRGEFD
jgi:hypothetical protein